MKATIAEQVAIVETKSKLYQDWVKIGIQFSGKKGFKKYAQQSVSIGGDAYDGLRHGMRIAVQVLEELPQMQSKGAL